MGKIIGYCRVSKKEQDLNCNALKQQIDRVKSAGAEIIYQDLESGRKNDRTNFTRLLTEIKQGKVSKIIATRLDRITRELETQIKFIKLINQFEVDLLILDQQIDTATASGKLQLNLIGAIAQNESDQLAERIQHGLNYLRKNKIPLKAPLGYEIQSSKLVFSTKPYLSLLGDKTTWSRFDLARWLINSYLTGEYSITKLCRDYNEKFGFKFTKHRRDPHFVSLSPSGLKHFLTNKVNFGHTVYYQNQPNEIIYYNTHEPLITEKEKIEIEQILKFNSHLGKWNHSDKIHPFSGLVYCSHCNRLLTASYSQLKKDKQVVGKRYFYRCRRYWLNQCPAKKTLDEQYLKEQVINQLRKKAYQILHFTAEPENIIISPQEQELKNQIATLETLPQNQIILEAIARLKQELTQLRKTSQTRSQLSQHKTNLLIQIYSSTTFWEILSPEQEKQVFRELIKKIYYDGKNISIFFLFD